jgi:hypothetical protein
MKSVSILSFIVSIFIFGSCSKDEHERYDLRFVHIMDNESSSVTVSDKANSIGTYNIYLSAPQFLDPVTVTYKITAGSGLTEGVDYELLNNATEVTFLPGIYDMPVRIRWQAHPVDPANDNSIRIELLGVSNSAFSLGLPGKDQYQKSLLITKVPS